MKRWAVAVLATVLLTAASAQSLTTAQFDSSSYSVGVGQSVSIDIKADFSAIILGFGVHIGFNPAIVSLGSKTVGPLWTPVFSPDTNGVGGLAPISGVSGSDILLATITLVGKSPGTTNLTLSINPGDLTQGFALAPSGFDSTSFIPSTFTVVPEPETGLLLVGGLLVVASRRVRH